MEGFQLLKKKYQKLIFDQEKSMDTLLTVQDVLEDLHFQELSEKCQNCNAACCVAFSLPLSKKQMFKELFKKKGKNKLECLKGLLFLKDISKSSLGIHIKKNNHLFLFDFIYSCRMLNRKNKCIVYKYRPEFCKRFDCKGHILYAYVDHDNHLGIPQLNKG